MLLKRTVALFASLPFLAALSCWSHDTANLVGRVKVSTGGGIPRAKVSLANPSKVLVRHLVSGAAGEYSVNATAVGNYTLHHGKENLR
jgi:hypothetical protein